MRDAPPANPIVRWSDEIARDPRFQENELLPHFVQLQREYARLLRQLDRVARISDGYQQTLLERNELLNQAAHHDALTGLSNRRDMVDRLNREVHSGARHGHAFSVILCDIDRFKQVNDTFGHKAGDMVLKEVARTAVETIRSEDVCGRWGGEEFLILLPHTEEAAAWGVAEKIRVAMEALETSCDGHTIRCTISAGVAGYHYGDDIDAVIRTADTRMYEAKQLGRNQVGAPPDH
ncbi:MAG TPA: diguanylate cyclase [Alkalispirochaeta sp.]|nr:diguanylate cyclase [Alkalispirochaeta sp.]